MPEYVPGRFYSVPTVEGAISGEDHGIYVIMGPWHEDADYLNFPAHHYHLHPQFAPARYMRKEHGVPKVFSHIIAKNGVYGAVERWVDKDEVYPVGSVVMRRRKCLRKMPPYPREMAPWMRKLTEAYADARIDLEHPVCPHRGADLSCVPVVRGCRTCPLHGLRFDSTTGRVLQFTKTGATK